MAVEGAMQWTPQPESVVTAVIADMGHIATLPEVTLRIIKLVEDPEATARDLSGVICHDPALAARVLKIVNSGFYGLPAKVASFQRAVSLLGLNALKMIAISASLARLFRGGQVCSTFNAHDLWTHCIAVACGARMLARRSDPQLVDEAFLGGMIHDVGILVEMQALRARFLEIVDRVDQAPGRGFRAAEIEVLGASHEDFGLGLCRGWNFPPCLACVAGYHHRPESLPAEDRALPMLVHVADLAAAQMGIGYCGTVEATLDDEQAAPLGLDAHEVLRVCRALPDATREAVDLLRG